MSMPEISSFDGLAMPLNRLCEMDCETVANNEDWDLSKSQWVIICNTVSVSEYCGVQRARSTVQNCVLKSNLDNRGGQDSGKIAFDATGRKETFDGSGSMPRLILKRA